MNPLAHQSEALEKSRDAFGKGVKSILLEMCCGAGKSLIMRLLADVPFVVFVFPSLALIAQFIAKYLDLPHLVVSSEGSTDPATIVAYLASSVSQHVICVTYNSLDVLIANLGGRVIDRGIFDEAHHVGSPTYSAMIVGRTDLFNEQVHLTATPRKGVDYGERVFHFPYSKALELEMVRKFRIRVCVRARGADGVELKDYHKLLAETAQKTGHTKGLVFSSNVTQMEAEDITCVDYFTNPDLMREVLQEMGWDIELEMNKITAGTSAAERDALLARFGLVDETFRILCSCRTLGEGIDTCLANLAMFADPKTTWEAIVQAIGRVTRRNRSITFEDDEATAVIPVFVDAEKYTACTTAEEMDTVLRENIGDFDTLRNFLAALEQSDPDLADQIINSKWTPKEVKDNAKKQGWQVGEEMSLQEALIAFLETDDIDEEPDLEEVARDHEKCIVIHTDLMEEPERYYGEGEMVRLLELRDGEAYCTLTKKEKGEKDDLEAPEKKKVVQFEYPLTWSLADTALGSSVMKYMVNDEQHEGRIRQLHEFYAKFGVPRYNGKRENEKSLDIWIKNRRRDKKKGRNSELCERIEREFAWWIWDVFKERSESKIQDLHEFFIANNEPPRNNGCRPNEKALYTWISNLRLSKKKGKRNRLCNLVERKFSWWKWDIIEDHHFEMIQRLHVFYKDNGVKPRRTHLDKNVRELATWISNRCNDKKLGINKELCDHIETEFPWWKWNYRAGCHDDTIQLLKVFYSQYGVPNKRGTRRKEKYLGTWISLRRLDKQKGLNKELCDRIDREFPWWKWEDKEGRKRRKWKNELNPNPEPKRPKTYAAPTLNESELRAPRDPTPPCDIATDFQTMTIQHWHQKAFTTRSETLGAIFQEQPAAWHAYHESRHLEYDPLDRIIEELKKARHQGVKTIADLGCGTAKLARSFYDTGDQRFNVQGFDHVAIPEWSTACDVSKCEHLMNDSFNIVVVCLGMWGTNKEDTLRSAYRILETNGVLYMVEPTRRWTADASTEESSPEPAQELVDLLKETGFDIQKAEIKEGDRILQFAFFKCLKP